MRRPLSSVPALLSLLACPAALAQSRPPPDAEALRDQEGEPVDPDDVAPALPRSTERTRAAPVRLSLLAWQNDALPLARDRGLGLVLTLPLERVLAPAPPLPPPERPGGFATADVLPFERALGPAARAPLPAPIALALPGAAPASFASEPAPGAFAALQVPAPQVSALCDAALRAAGLGGRLDGRLDGLGARSRSSAVLPELRLRATQSNDQDLRLSYADADPYRTQASGGSALLFEARATWRLDRLLFADDEVAVERLRGDVREQRQRLVLKVVEAIGAWQKAQLVLFDPEASPRERAGAVAQAANAAVLLDALSAGAWSRLRARDAGGAPEPKAPQAALTGTR